MTNNTNNPLYDALTSLDVSTARWCAATVLNGIQDFQPAAQMAGVAAMFLLLCERFDMSPRTALQVAENMLRAAKYADADHFQGVRDYLANEV